MASNKNYSFINYNNLPFFIYMIAIILMNFANCFIIGKYPLLKKLNNKKYLLISNNGTTFLDPTLTQSSNDIIFEQGIYENDSEGPLATSIVQFSQEEGNLILALIKDTLYIFLPNETLLINQTIIFDYDILYPKKPYFLFPYKKEENIYTTCLLYLTDGDENHISNIFMTFQNIFYNYVNNTITLSEKVNYDLEEVPNSIFMGDYLYNEIGCTLLKQDNSNYLYCIFGIYIHLYIYTFIN